jgi:glycerol uptake facilitator-like aquaporin
MTATLSRRLVAEFIGTGFLVAAVVGSGIMGETLAGGNIAIALLANTIATGAALVVLIPTFGPISGAHFNPVFNPCISPSPLSSSPSSRRTNNLRIRNWSVSG